MNNDEKWRLTGEGQLQHFIAEHPWLLNLDYERVPELKNGGIEFQIGEQNRIDLVLKDKASHRPVVVEFKVVPFYRENVGQLLEYKARIATSFNKENSVIYSIFKDNILCPKLALVVPTCDDYSRLACNMAGIDVYEYKNFQLAFKDPAQIKTIENFTQSMKNDPMPLSIDRPLKLEENVYRSIKKVLEEQQLSSAYREPRENRAYFFNQMTNQFVNRWLFADETISMGVYEDIFGTNDVVFVYYSHDKSLFDQFAQNYEQKFKYPLDRKWEDQYSEGFLTKKIPRNEFFTNVEPIFREELNHYRETFRSLPGGKSIK